MGESRESEELQLESEEVLRLELVTGSESDAPCPARWDHVFWPASHGRVLLVLYTKSSEL
jgi:hypothetical protein